MLDGRKQLPVFRSTKDSAKKIFGNNLLKQMDVRLKRTTYPFIFARTVPSSLVHS